jgi:hypothetical protein
MHNGNCWIDNLAAAEILVMIDRTFQQLTSLTTITKFVSQSVTMPYPLPDRVVETNGKPLLFQQPIATSAKVEGFSTPGKKIQQYYLEKSVLRKLFYYTEYRDLNQAPPNKKYNGMSKCF